MNPSQEALNVVQAQMFEAIDSGQRAATQSAEALGRAFATMTPLLPVPPTLAGFGPASLTNGLAGPVELIDSAYDFAAQLLDFNKQFVHALLAVSKVGSLPVTADQPAAKAKEATTPKTAAKQASAPTSEQPAPKATPAKQASAPKTAVKKASAPTVIN